jgi:hypothetical protein
MHTSDGKKSQFAVRVFADFKFEDPVEENPL